MNNPVIAEVPKTLFATDAEVTVTVRAKPDNFAISG
jgi:hypothetical protein